MSRLTAWVILIGAAVLVFSLAFTPFQHQTSTWVSTDSGGLTRVTIECPSPFRVLALGDEPVDPDDAGLCDPSARTLAVEAGLVILTAGLMAWRPVTRPRPEPIEPLSRAISAPGRPRSD
jgi:hypothetical protein